MGTLLMFLGLLINLGVGGLIKEPDGSNYGFSILASGCYLFFLIDHLHDRGTVLVYIIFFVALLTVVLGLAKATEGDFNFIAVLAVVDCIFTFIALVMAIMGMPHVGIFY